MTGSQIFDLIHIRLQHQTSFDIRSDACAWFSYSVREVITVDLVAPGLKPNFSFVLYCDYLWVCNFLIISNVSSK